MTCIENRVNIDFNNPQNCSIDCTLSVEYSSTNNPVVSNKSTYLEISVDSTNKIIFQKQTCRVEYVRIYSPSINLYDGIQKQGEIIIKHTSFGDQRDFHKDTYICIPLTKGDDTQHSNFFNILDKILIDPVSTPEPATFPFNIAMPSKICVSDNNKVVRSTYTSDLNTCKDLCTNKRICNAISYNTQSQKCILFKSCSDTNTDVNFSTYVKTNSQYQNQHIQMFNWSLQDIIPKDTYYYYNGKSMCDTCTEDSNIIMFKQDISMTPTQCRTLTALIAQDISPYHTQITNIMKNNTPITMKPDGTLFMDDGNMQQDTCNLDEPLVEPDHNDMLVVIILVFICVIFFGGILLAYNHLRIV
jgi:carbonic anhydrase